MVVLGDTKWGRVGMEAGDREVGRGISMMRNMKRDGDGEGRSNWILRGISWWTVANSQYMNTVGLIWVKHGGPRAVLGAE